MYLYYRERKDALPPRLMLYFFHRLNGRFVVLCLVQMHANNRGNPFMDLMRLTPYVNTLGVTRDIYYTFVPESVLTFSIAGGVDFTLLYYVR